MTTYCWSGGRWKRFPAESSLIIEKTLFTSMALLRPMNPQISIRGCVQLLLSKTKLHRTYRDWSDSHKHKSVGNPLVRAYVRFLYLIQAYTGQPTIKACTCILCCTIVVNLSLPLCRAALINYSCQCKSFNSHIRSHLFARYSMWLCRYHLPAR